MSNKHIIIFGPPGSGKDTQVGLLLEQYPELMELSTGKMLRALAKEDQRLAKLLSAGSLEHTSDQANLLVEEKLEVTDNKVILYNGYPRTIEQFEILINLLQKLDGVVEIALILLDVSDQEVIRRLTIQDRGRSDDRIEVIKYRLNLYQEYTQAVINRAQVDTNSDILSINGERPIEDINQDIVQYLVSQGYIHGA